MSAQTQANTLKQLNQSILAAKTKAEQLSAKINLIDYYSQVNPRKWRETNLVLQSERNKYPGKQAQNRLNLIYAE